MTSPLPFRLLNVFAADAPFTGNALCVFEHGDGLSDTQMQALARQMNLAETTFLFPSERAAARIRIFTPTHEMPFAGHPTLGSAHVVRALRGGDHPLALEMEAGVIPVMASAADEDTWTLRANAPRARLFEGTREDVRRVLEIRADDFADDPLWIDTGAEQLIVPLTDAGAVQACRPTSERLAAAAPRGIYAWAPAGDAEIVARFFSVEGNAVVEDPGTGSACANLGGWHLVKAKGPREATVLQGERTGRPCRLGLRVSADREVFVSGKVVLVGGGTFTI